MYAQVVRLTELLEGPKQFIVPVFQRDYSWGTKHCLQLWEDMMRVGSDENTKDHFVGSIVYIGAEDNSARITRWLLISHYCRSGDSATAGVGRSTLFPAMRSL